MIRTGMRGIIELIRKHPKIHRILRCESPYFHHWLGRVQQLSSLIGLSIGPAYVRLVSCCWTAFIAIQWKDMATIVSRQAIHYVFYNRFRTTSVT